MSGRNRGLTVALALLALIGLASFAGRGVFAQDAATPTPSASSGSSGTTDTTKTDQWNAFLNDFASALGVTDQATIDAALNTAIDKMLTDKVASGDLTQEQADVIKAEVANGDYSGFRHVLGGAGMPGAMGGEIRGSGKGGFIGDGRGGHRGGMQGPRGNGGYGPGQSGSNKGTDDDGAGGSNGTTPPADSTPAALSGVTTA
jgi:hypothetical protein